MDGVGGRWGLVELAENIAPQPSLAGAWAELGNNNITNLNTSWGCTGPSSTQVLFFIF